MNRKLYACLSLPVLCLMAITIFAATPIHVVCENIQGDKNKILALSYDEFAQTHEDSLGWHPLARSHCYRQAAELIDDYLIAHPHMPNWQKANLAYHGGRMWAVEGNNKKAIMDLQRAKFSKEKVAAHVQWNIYINAMIAFLQKDKSKLQLYRNQIAQQPPINGEIINLENIDIMLNNIGKPYSYVYQKINEAE